MSPPSRRSFAPFLLGALSVALVVGILALAGTFDSSDPTRSATGAAAAPSAAPPAAQGGAPTSVADIYARAAPAVVFVQASGARARVAIPGGLPEGTPRSTASGSGFVIDADGSIVTNQHVIDGASTVRVRFGEDGESIPAKVTGQDPSTDIALLKIDPKRVEGGIKALQLADSAKLRPGEATIAIGAPFGLAGSVTTGVVSALNRDIQSPNGFSISGVVQTDAAINPGNSGGPLLDAQGRAIGVNSQIATGGSSNANSGVGFAVPIDTVKDIVPELERGRAIKRPYLGLSTMDATSSAGGATVRAVVPGRAADDAGLRRGDRIVRVGDTTVREASDVSSAIEDREPGDAVEIRYVRGGDERTATVKLGTRPDEATQAGG